MMFGSRRRNGTPPIACENLEARRLLSAAAFRTPIITPAHGEPLAIATGDFNGDGQIDVVTADYDNPAAASLFLGNGDGTFKPAVQLPVAPMPVAIAVADLNGDG